MKNNVIKTYIQLLVFCLSVLLGLGSCAEEIERPFFEDDSDVPEGHFRLDLNLVAVNGKTFLTRADADPDPLLSHIDDVHLLVFEATNGEVGPDSPLKVRSFYEYGVKQKIYLKKGVIYYVYVVANLDDSNCVEGTVEHFFDDILTYGDLQRKHVRFLERTPRDLNKMIMATKAIVPLELKAESNVFSPTITLQRLQTQFVVNIYNRIKAADDQTVVSGVYPSTLSAIDMPRYSYLFEHPLEADGSHDYGFTLEDKSQGYYTSQTEFLPPVQEVIERRGKYYTRQTVEFFTFENRRGSVDDIKNYDEVTIEKEGEDGETISETHTVPNVYGRKALAPEYSSYLLLNSLTEGNALLTYLHAGKGRDMEDLTIGDDITNFDVDRSCVYHFNVYINSVDSVEIDSRRAYLDQLVFFTMPDMRRVDAHYMDIPSFILSTTKGYAKLQSGTCDVDDEGNIIYNGLDPQNWVPMEDSWDDNERWLRFSWTTPFNPSARPINTSLYVGMSNVDGVTAATPIMHFNEYVDETGVEKASIPAKNPPQRWAAIRVGFVPNATSADSYEQGVIDGMEAAFYVTVGQYGLKTIGYLGGYKDGHYTSLLGIESVEEYIMRYYDREGFNRDDVNDGPKWRYKDVLSNLSQAYDGRRATIDHYNEYRFLFNDEGIPPKRWDVVTKPEPGIYNPVSNTNAADYCIRKNRDINGNGIIDEDEVKWYLPTPIQVMQMYTWRDAFRGAGYTLNLDYRPFENNNDIPSRYYWTTNDHSATHAYVVDFFDNAVMTESKPKNERHPVRCVRDIPGDPEEPNEMFYIEEGTGYLVANLNGNVPNALLEDGKDQLSEKTLHHVDHNTYGRKFIISRWYATGNSSHSATPRMIRGNDDGCGAYTEGDSRTWVLPSQKELTLIYASSGILEELMQAKYGEPDQTDTYNAFQNATHWGITDIGNGSSYWYVDFSTGAAGTQKKNNSAYMRCVSYIATP